MTTPARLNVVVASDDNYVQHLAVTLLSVVDNCSQPEALSLYVLDAGICDNNRNRLQQLFAERNVRFEILSPELKDTGSIPLKRYGHAALLRISIAELLPQEDERAIYLDCDIVVAGDIAELGRIDMEGHPVAAVENLGHRPGQRLGIGAGDYFNSGVLVIDLALWRKRGIGQQVLSYMQENSEHLHFPDQDGLNAILHNDWKRLPLRWNQQPASYSMLKKQAANGKRKQEFRDAVENPVVIHFLSSNKPWHYMTYHPLKGFYWHYLRQTPWKNYHYPDRRMIDVARKWLSLDKQFRRWLRQRRGPQLPH